MKCWALVLTVDLMLAFRFSLKHHFSSRPQKCMTRIANYHLSQNFATYNHQLVERKWQEFWDKNKTFKAIRRKGHPKKYILDMFPYPSGTGLHVGHPEGYTASDIMARYWRMKDYDVLHPMGWDAFGLPAEQHAINTGTHPAETTHINIKTFKRQLKSLGFSYDWDRELSTTDEDYVRWTQWIFLQLFKSGLAAQSDVNVNWCPSLGTVLANEEIIDGLSERGGHPVLKQPLRQWVLKITQYAEKLEAGLADLQWPEGTIQAQKQWIGRSEGSKVQFAVDGLEGRSVEVFTTRLDTLFGATYLVLAPEHSLVPLLTASEQRSAVEAYQAQCALKSDLQRSSLSEAQKTGVFLGTYALNPLTNERIPIWVADYVLGGYGSGSVMAVPAHDSRDWAFAQKFGLPIRQVIQAPDGSPSALPFTSYGILCNSEGFSGLPCDQARVAILERLTAKGLGASQTNFKLRDWVFSRQRYWGEPIPIYFPVEILTPDGQGSPLLGTPHKIHFDRPIPLREDELPLTLPPMKNFQPGNDPQGCLARMLEWRYFQRDGQWFARETNTMPQWAGSCWYYLRFTDPRNPSSFASTECQEWLPVDLYVGGQEHAVLHLLYARFWHKVLFDLGLVNTTEPFPRLVHQGTILGSDGEKMSKSRGNVVNPDDIVLEFGADALRLYEMFMGPLEAVKPWQSSQIIGVVRFRDRVFSLATGPISEEDPDPSLLRVMHKTIKKVTHDIESLSFNTAISSLMVFSNSLLPRATRPRAAVQTLIALLSPFAPHLCEECWAILTGSQVGLSHKQWPQYNESLCGPDSTSKVVIQVNSKNRVTLDLPLGLSQEEVSELAKEQPQIKKHLSGQRIHKIIYVDGKLMNFVLEKQP